MFPSRFAEESLLDVGGPLLQMIGAMLQQRVVFLKVSVSKDCEHSNNRKEHDEDEQKSTLGSQWDPLAPVRT